MKNQFKYSSNSYGPLQGNPKHQFAMRHALQVFESDSIYTLIPKNACSTIRLSLAFANGCISTIDDNNWIHANNLTFNSNLHDAYKAKYTFVVLRCPFRRLASVFLDKIVSKEPPAWKYRDALKREVELDDLTFSDFVGSLHNKAVLNSDIHWRPQVDFLLYEEYSDYFSVENFDLAVERLKERIDLEIIDARQLTLHGTTEYKLDNSRNYSKDCAFDIASLKRQGLCPSHDALYNDDLVEQIKLIYRKDLNFYKSKLGQDDLLFV